jgi:LmbE family N-acetylglucosaminyl deacetylase
MTIEAEAIPYEPTRLRGERLLVLAPHPDDEVIGCGGLTAQHFREHRVVRVVIATDGAEADTAANDRDGYRALREQESRHGLERLGGVPDVHFLRFPDRQLGSEIGELLAAQLREFAPDLILVPSPLEIHPDHFALSRAFCDLVQRDPALFAELAVARVAFYEVGIPLRPNAIVDITDVADAKYHAIAAHESQTKLRDYTAFARGLNAYRAMTMPPGTAFAEAYYVVELPSLRTLSFSALRARCGSPPSLKVTHEPLPISVVVRTKDRPLLLQEALASIRQSGYPCEVVVVNDGGAPLENLGDVKRVDHETSRGRSEAANSGVRAATGAFITFLDDDDLHHREHLPTLANAVRSASRAGWYTDALSTFLRPAASGAYEVHSSQRLYSHDYDAELLVLDNYIPLPTLLVARDTFLDAGGFDPEFDLFEDWDFLLRLSRRGSLLHIASVTCEVRHFEGGDSILLAASAESQTFRDARRQIWQKHADLLQHDTIGTAFDRQKRRLLEVSSRAVDSTGRAARGELELARLEREKSHLLAQLAAVHGSLNEANVRRASVEAVNASLQASAANHEATYAELRRLDTEVRQLRAMNTELHQALTETNTARQAERVEIARLQGLLDMIFRSRTWKLHTIVEKVRGRG